MGPALRSRTASKPLEQIPVVIIGGGVCGLLAADRCLREGIDFVLFERGEEYGGNWVVRANTYSHLQARRRSLGQQLAAQDPVPLIVIMDDHNLIPLIILLVVYHHPCRIQAHAALYQWDKDFPLDKSPFTKVAAPNVLQNMRDFAEKHLIRHHTRFGAEVSTIIRKSERRYCKTLLLQLSLHNHGRQYLDESRVR